MDLSDLKQEIQKLSENCIAEIDRDENNLKNVVRNFLTAVCIQVLLIEVSDSQTGAKRVMEALSQLTYDQEDRDILKNYLGVENQTLVHWKQLEELLSASKVFQTFKHLLVCDFSLLQQINGESGKLLSKIINILKVDTTKKLILISSKKGLVDEQMQRLEKKMFLKFDYFRNEVTSEIYEDKIKALMGRARQGHVDDLEELIRNGVDVNATDGLGRTALHAAAETGQNDVIIRLLRYRAKIVPDRDGSLPLHVAAQKGHVDTVLIFVENNIDINIAGQDGLTALHEAAGNGHIGVVKILLENGADVNAKDNDGGIALVYAAHWGYNDVVKYLLDNGADVNAKDNGGFTALHSAPLKGHNDVVKTLLKNGADVNAKSNDEWTALHSAASGGHNDVVKTLQEAGADVNAKYYNGRTALFFAAHNGHNNVVKILVKNGADVNAKNNDEWTALHSAASGGHYDVVKILQEYGADVNIKNNNNETPLDIAKYKGYRNIVGLLCERISEKVNS